jgi:hypothetical protein
VERWKTLKDTMENQKEEVKSVLLRGKFLALPTAMHLM